MIAAMPSAAPAFAKPGFPSRCSAGPSIVLHASDELRRKRLERDLRCFAKGEAESEVMVVHLPQGEALPAEASNFDGAILVLSDDPSVMADKTLRGVLPSAAASRQISAAVLALAEGLTVRVRGAEESFPEPAQGRVSLTPRELEVLGLVGEGMSNKTIARKLGISAHTVKYHLEAVFAKLGARSRAEAVTRGLRQGLFTV